MSHSRVRAALEAIVTFYDLIPEWQAIQFKDFDMKAAMDFARAALNDNPPPYAIGPGKRTPLQRRQYVEGAMLSGDLDISALAERFSCSKDTIRTDIHFIERKRRHPTGIGKLELSTRAHNALWRAGITTIHELQALMEANPDSVLSIRNAGVTTMAEIRYALERWNRSQRTGEAHETLPAQPDDALHRSQPD